MTRYPNDQTQRALKISLLMLTLLVVSSGTLRAEDADRGPILGFSPAPIDLGTVDRGELLVHEIQVRNDGDEPLVTSDTFADCTCATASGDQTLQPGQTGVIRVTIDTMGLDGPGGTDVAFSTNDPAAPKVTLVIAAEIKSYLQVDPPQNRFLAVQGEPGGSVDNVLRTKDGTDFQIVGVTSPYPFLTFDYEAVAPEQRDEAYSGSQWKITTLFPSDAPVGPLTGAVEIRTDHPKEKRIEIPISGFVRPSHSLSPPSMHFGELELDGPKRSPFWFSAFSRDPVTVTDVTTDVPGIEIELEPVTMGRKYKIVLNFTPEMAGGAFEGTVKVQTDSERFPELIYPLTGTVVLSPDAER